MADGLRRLVSTESGRVLQEKLESWYRDYQVGRGRPPGDRDLLGGCTAGGPPQPAAPRGAGGRLQRRRCRGARAARRFPR